MALPIVPNLRVGESLFDRDHVQQRGLFVIDHRPFRNERMIANIEDKRCVSDVISESCNVNANGLALGVSHSQDNPKVPDWIIWGGNAECVARLQIGY